MKSSMTARIRKRLASPNPSARKFSYQRSPGSMGTGYGVLVPVARLRPRLRFTASPSSLYSLRSFLWFIEIPSRSSTGPSRRRSGAMSRIRCLISGQSGSGLRCTVFGSTPTSRHALRCETSKFAVAVSAADRSCIGVASSFPEDLSGSFGELTRPSATVPSHCPTSDRPEAPSVGHSRSQALWASAPRTRPGRHTWLSTCRRLLSLPRADDGPCSWPRHAPVRPGSR